MALYRNLIGGEWTAGGEASRNINPSNLSDVVGEYASADEAQVRAATTVKTSYVAP